MRRALVASLGLLLASCAALRGKEGDEDTAQRLEAVARERETAR